MGAVTMWVSLAITVLNTALLILQAIPGNQGETVLQNVILILKRLIGRE